MSQSYPPPNSALMVWLAGDGYLSVRVPHATDPEGPTHIVRLTPDAEGMKQLTRILSQRMRAADGRATIGTPAAPTQHQLEQLSNILLQQQREETRAQREADRVRALAQRAERTRLAASPDELADILFD